MKCDWKFGMSPNSRSEKLPTYVSLPPVTPLERLKNEVDQCHEDLNSLKSEEIKTLKKN